MALPPADGSYSRYNRTDSSSGPAGGAYLSLGDDVRGKFDNSEVPLADGPLDIVVAHSGRGRPAGRWVPRSTQTRGLRPSGLVLDAGRGLCSVLDAHACGRPARVRYPGRGGASRASARHGRHLLSSLRGDSQQSPHTLWPRPYHLRHS